jgi:Nucleotidyltransferase
VSGGADPVYITARSVLLTALEALADQRESVVVVGAHAIYLHAASADLQVAPFTTDADLAFDPARLHAQPLLEQRMAEAGFALVDEQPGRWLGPQDVLVDLMVPEALGGAGARGARIPPHDKRAARKARGLEAAMIDNAVRTVEALDPADPRRFDVQVAGPSALLVSKLIKIGERIGGRVDGVAAKDGLDVFRLLRMTNDPFAEVLPRLLADAMAGETTREALGHLEQDFTAPTGRGVQLVVKATAASYPSEDIEIQVSALSRRLLERIPRN